MAAVVNGADLKNGLTLNSLLERTGTGQFPKPLEYKDAVKSALQSMRQDELRYVESNKPGGHGLLLGPGLGLVIGASLGSRSCRAVLLHPHGWLAEDEEKLPYFEAENALEGQLGMAPEDLLRRVAAPIARLMHRAASDSSFLVDGRLPLLGIAVGWPTSLRHDKRPAGSGLSHPAWGAAIAGVDVQLAELLGIDPTLSNAINATNAAGLWVAWKLTSSAHRETTARRAEVIMCLRLSAAIGGSSVIVPVPEGARRPPFLDSSLIEGKTGVAGDLAHLYMPAGLVEEVSNREDPEDGLAEILPIKCSCGRRHCLQSYASGDAVLDRLRRSGIEVDRGLRDIGTDELLDTLQSTDRYVVDRALEDAGRLVGLALAGPVLMLNPRSVTLTGALAVAEVKAGISAEQRRWSHRNDSAFDVLLDTDGDKSTKPRLIVAHGAALAVMRSTLYRRLWPARPQDAFQNMYSPHDSTHLIDPEFASALNEKFGRA